MRQFLIKILGFHSILICYFGATSIINLFLGRNQAIPIENTEVLIAGDSHPLRSLNPAFFKSSQNISQATEPYVLTYWKIKRILDQYIPDTLILGFAPHNISQFNDMKFSQKGWAGEMFERSYLITDFRDIADKIPFDRSALYKTLFRQMALFPRINHIHYIGHYTNNTKSNISDWKSTAERHFYFENKELGVSNVQISYLDSIANQCIANNIVLVLVRSPVHKYYLDAIPPSITQKYSQLKNRYTNKIIVIDETQAVYPDSLFLNSDHLNEYGATKFTSKVIGLIKQARSTKAYSSNPRAKTHHQDL